MTTTDEELDSLRAWLLVVFSAGTMIILWGLIFTFTVYGEALKSDFGLSSLEVSSVFSAMTAMFFVIGGTAGIVFVNIDYRPIVATSAMVIGVAVGYLQHVSSFIGVIISFVLIGAASGTVYVIILSMIPQWFDRYEGRAMGITVAGNGLGVLLLPFVWVWLLARIDIQGALAIVGGLATLILLAASFIFRRPRGISRSETGSPGIDEIFSLFSNPHFVVALVGLSLLWAWYFVLSADLVKILESAGIPRNVAATAFGTIGGISIIARLGSGATADRIGARETLIIGVILAVSGQILLLILHGLTIMYISLIIFGIGLGAIATLYPPIIVNRFGQGKATAVVGVFMVVQASSAFGAPIATQLLLNITGGYTIPFIILIMVTLFGAVMFYWGTRLEGKHFEGNTNLTEP